MPAAEVVSISEGIDRAMRLGFVNMKKNPTPEAARNPLLRKA